MDYNEQKVDEMALALLNVARFDEGGVVRAWKEMDGNVLDRLHEKGYIGNPGSKAKSVVLTEEGARLSEELFNTHFGSESGE